MGKDEPPSPSAPHPFVWTVLYLPFGALTGFVTVALTFLATKHGLSISEGALLNGAQMGTQWLKWLWAPIVDVTLTPRKWYVLSTAASAVGVLAMSMVPLGPDTLGLLLAIIAGASLINSAVGMAVEALIASATPPDQVGRVSAWFQAGNLGGAGLGGALGLFLITHLPAPWMGGAIMGVIFMLCCIALRFTPKHESLHAHMKSLDAVKGVIRDLGKMLRTKGGLLSAILCVLPVGTGAAQTVLTQAEVAGYWGAGAREVELMQGLTVGVVTAIGRLRRRLALSSPGAAHGLCGDRDRPGTRRYRHGAEPGDGDDVRRVERDVRVRCGPVVCRVHGGGAERDGRRLGRDEVQRVCLARELPDLVAGPAPRPGGTALGRATDAADRGGAGRAGRADLRGDHAARVAIEARGNGVTGGVTGGAGGAGGAGAFQK